MLDRADTHRCLFSRCIGIATFTFFVATGSPTTAQLLFEREPIKYSQSQPRDSVAKLQQQLVDENDGFQSEADFGYLRDLLRNLEVPISSQTLVFSKTSLQRHLISPSNPRAIYFNDDTYIAWIPGAPMIEIASIDPLLGTVFYTVEQESGKEAGRMLRQTQRCLFCHASSDSGRVPGLLMMSVYTDTDGKRLHPSDAVSADSGGAMSGRWGGWFVTGTHGTQRHLGNLTIESGASVGVEELDAGANLLDLSPWFNKSNYLSPHSDIVALMVLHHQVSLQNQLISANHLARARLMQTVDRSDSAANSEQTNEDQAFLGQIADLIVDGLLMVDELPLDEPVEGSSRFAEDFARRGPFDSAGRSLRDLELQSRLFRYRLSYLIYSESFDALPEPLLKIVYQRILDVLTAEEALAKYAHLSAPERLAILQILRQTKSGLPATWNAK